MPGRRRRSRRFALVAAGTVCVALTAACHGGSPVQVAVSPASALFDEPFQTSVTGLTPGQRVTVRLTAQDADGTTWSSSAVFDAVLEGRVDTTQAPVSGDYAAADPMGLVETLTPGAPDRTYAASLPWTMTVSVVVDGATRATTTVTRQGTSLAGLRSTDLRPANVGVYGTLFLPATPAATPRPAVVVVGGSEGGLSTEVAASALAAHGYPALALAYFHAPGLPDNLENIPLEYFATAARLLAEQPGVDPLRVVIWGTSRGSEAALLTAAHFPDLVHAVIGSVPASEPHGGLPDGSKPAWTLGGQPVAAGEREALFDPSPDDPAAIPVEQVGGPLLLVCGGKDQVWPSCIYADAIRARLSARHAPAAPTVLEYPEAGHFVGALLPYSPSTATGGTTASGAHVDSGGTYQANQAARADAWPKVLAWLEHLT